MGVFDFNNNRAQNLSDPKFEKDSVNLRTLKLFSADTISVASANTISITSAITIANKIIYEIYVPLTAGQIQSGFTIPINTGIPLPGIGKAIEVISASIIFTANTTPFTSTQISLKTNTAVDPQFYDFASIIGGGVNTFAKMAAYPSIAVTIVENKQLFIQTDANSIGVGDGVAKIYIAYRIIII